MYVKKEARAAIHSRAMNERFVCIHFILIVACSKVRQINLFFK